MTGCGCHDPLVFGHWRQCRLELGPVRNGGTTRRETGTLISMTVRYSPDVPRDIERPDTAAMDRRRQEWLARNRIAIHKQQEFRQGV